MFSQKSYTQKLGTCSDTIAKSGCFITSFSNLYTLNGGVTDPLTVNKICTDKGYYVDGCSLVAPSLATNFGAKYEKTTTVPKQICIAETDHWKSAGVPKHFFVYDPVHKFKIDPLDINPKWVENNYRIVSYRIFTFPPMGKKGVDVSHWQGNKVGKKVDWAKVLPQVEYVIMKATQGSSFVDTNFAGWQKELRGKTKLGYYHFADGTDPIKEAQHFIKTVGQLQEGEFLILDWERLDAGAVEWCKKFLSQIDTHVPMIYMGSREAKAFDWSTLTKYPLWIARYGTNDGTMQVNMPPVTGAWKDWDIWQYTSAGKLAGIETVVDLNIAKELPVGYVKEITDNTIVMIKELKNVAELLTGRDFGDKMNENEQLLLADAIVNSQNELRRVTADYLASSDYKAKALILEEENQNLAKKLLEMSAKYTKLQNDCGNSVGILDAIKKALGLA